MRNRMAQAQSLTPKEGAGRKCSACTFVRLRREKRDAHYYTVKHNGSLVVICGHQALLATPFIV